MISAPVISQSAHSSRVTHIELYHTEYIEVSHPSVCFLHNFAFVLGNYNGIVNVPAETQGFLGVRRSHIYPYRFHSCIDNKNVTNDVSFVWRGGLGGMYDM